MKNKIRFLILIGYIILFTSCSTLKTMEIELSGRTNDPPRYEALAYGIMENGKVNRMGISKNDIDKMRDIISNKYGIKFSSINRICATDITIKYYYIKFYDDLKIIVKGKEHIISKKYIKMEINKINRDYFIIEYNYHLPIDIAKIDNNEYILDIGEIEILDKNGKIIRAKEKIPPILFKKKVHVVLASEGINYTGWVESYPGGLEALRKLEK